MTSRPKQSQLEADVRARGLEYECPTCGMKAGKRCAMLRRNVVDTDDLMDKRTTSHLPPERSHPERGALAWRPMVAAGEVWAP